MTDLINLARITSEIKRYKFVKQPYPTSNYTIHDRLVKIDSRLNKIQNDLKIIYKIIRIKNEQIACGEIDENYYI